VLAVRMAVAVLDKVLVDTAVLVVTVQCVLFIPEPLVHSHQQTQVICNEIIYSH